MSNGKYILIIIGTEFFSGALADEFNLKNLLFTRGIRFKTLIRNEELAKILNAAFKEYEGDGGAKRLAVFGLIAQFFATLLRDEQYIIEGTKNSEAARRYAQIPRVVLRLRPLRTL